MKRTLLSLLCFLLALSCLTARSAMAEDEESKAIKVFSRQHKSKTVILKAHPWVSNLCDVS